MYEKRVSSSHSNVVFISLQNTRDVNGLGSHAMFPRQQHLIPSDSSMFLINLSRWEAQVGPCRMNLAEDTAEQYQPKWVQCARTLIDEWNALIRREDGQPSIHGQCLQTRIHSNLGILILLERPIPSVQPTSLPSHHSIGLVCRTRERCFELETANQPPVYILWMEH